MEKTEFFEKQTQAYLPGFFLGNPLFFSFLAQKT
jgi:hypothetical protein